MLDKTRISACVRMDLRRLRLTILRGTWLSDLGPDNIRVNAIAPGAIRTAALATVLSPEIEKAMLKHTPLGRLASRPNCRCGTISRCASHRLD